MSDVSNGEGRGHLSHYWWLRLIAGLVLIAAGILVFCYPAQSYEALTLVFGIVILISGIAQLSVGISGGKYYQSRGWAIAAGVLDIIIGILFMCWPTMTAYVIPIILAIWFLYSGILAISFSSQMRKGSVGGSGWGIFFGILMIILAICLFFQPWVTGVVTVVVFMGLSFIVMGVNYLFQAFTYRPN